MKKTFVLKVTMLLLLLIGVNRMTEAQPWRPADEVKVQFELYDAETERPIKDAFVSVQGIGNDRRIFVLETANTGNYYEFKIGLGEPYEYTIIRDGYRDISGGFTLKGQYRLKIPMENIMIVSRNEQTFSEEMQIKNNFMQPIQLPFRM